jgi:cellulose synthase/poly-beta-1,6-N-acetylglucosamine synthase-like glycosyltransferase
LITLENKPILFKGKITKRFPKISILVPAYNEEKTIGNALSSISELDYPKGKIETIVIDNGSTDGTSKITKMFKKVKLIRMPKPDKARALNTGLKVARGEVVGILDADTMVSKDCLKKMIGYLDDSKVAAVTNYITVDSKTNMLSKFQNIEYIISGISKKILSILDSFYIIPGTLSLVKKNLIKKIGFSSDTLTEDMDLALSLIKRNYKIVNCLNAEARTVVPKTIKNWAKQRIRWYRGYVQNTNKHKDVLFNNKYLALGWFILPIAGYAAIMIGIYLTCFMFVNFIHDTMVGIRSISYLPIIDQITLYLDDLTKINFIYYPYYYLTFTLVMITSLIVILMPLNLIEKVNKKTLLLVFVYMPVYYTFIMIYWMISCVLEIFRWKRRW